MPRGDAFASAEYGRVRTEMNDRFGGITSFTRAPAEGMWKEGGHTRTRRYRRLRDHGARTRSSLVGRLPGRAWNDGSCRKLSSSAPSRWKCCSAARPRWNRCRSAGLSCPNGVDGCPSLSSCPSLTILARRKHAPAARRARQSEDPIRRQDRVHRRELARRPHGTSVSARWANRSTDTST